jgi:hypothetical protein
MEAMERWGMAKRTANRDGNSTQPNMRTSAAWRGFAYSANVILLAVFFLCACDRENIVPQHLLGEWKTAAPKYADRTLKFGERSVIFGIGEGEEVAHAIENISAEQGKNGKEYTFSYRDADGQKETLTVIYRPDSGGTLQIKNSEAMWKKADSGQSGQ